MGSIISMVVYCNGDYTWSLLIVSLPPSQLGVLSDMTILRLTDQNALLEKGADKHEDQMLEARRIIRGLQKQLKTLNPGNVLPKHETTQTDMEVSW